MNLPKREFSNWVLIRRLLGLAWHYRLGCVYVISQQVVLVVLALAQLGLTGLGIDVIRHHVTPGSAPIHWPFGFTPVGWSPLGQVALIAGTILGLALVHAMLRFRAAITVSNLVLRVVVQLRTEVYDKLQRLSFRFFDANQSGSIINRVAGDVQAVRMFIDGVIIQVLTVALSLAVYLAYMLSVHVPLTFACLATTPLLWWGAVRFSRTVRPAYLRSSELIDRLVLVLSENIQGMPVIKGFGREKLEVEEFKTANRAARDQMHWIFRRISVFQPVMGLLTQLNMVVLLGYGGWLVIHGQIALGGGLFVFANLLHQFANQISQVTNIANSIQSSLTGAERVFEILDAPLEVENPPRPVRPTKSRGAVRFENLSFGYRPESNVVEDVHLDVRPGQCIAVVGATGAGKTTLLSLIPRFYDPTAGRVLVDGIDVRQWDLDRLRRNVGLVFQESFLFSNTVASNIAFGQPEATFEQIERAARIAAADEFIRHLPDGYDTVIGEHGCNLSGGQRQRLAIARAILLEPPILILDDALASIDPGTEHEILAAMESAMRGRTTFVIAHRLSTLRRADLVVVLERGRIVQRGTHQQLLVGEGHYLANARLQAAGAAMPAA